MLRYVRVSILSFHNIGLLLVFCRAGSGELRQQAHSFRLGRLGFGRGWKARKSGLSIVQREDSCISLGDASGTSIIDVGLLRPAAAPGGRRVDGSRLGVAILHTP